MKDDAVLMLLDVLIRVAHPQCSPLILHSKLAALASGLLLYLTLRDDTQALSSLLVRASPPCLASQPSTCPLRETRIALSMPYRPHRLGSLQMNRLVFSSSSRSTEPSSRG